MLSTEQQSLFNLLAPGAYAFSELDGEQQQLLAATLRPIGPFSTEQQALLTNWYLLITPDQLAAANATLAPLKRGISGRTTIDDRTTTNADLLTDCIRPGDTYHAIAPLLATLKLIKLNADQFPIPDQEFI